MAPFQAVLSQSLIQASEKIDEVGLGVVVQPPAPNYERHTDQTQHDEEHREDRAVGLHDVRDTHSWLLRLRTKMPEGATGAAWGGLDPLVERDGV